MKLQTLKTLAMAAGVKLILTTASPLQHLLDTPGVTHEFLNEQAFTILRQDGFGQWADVLQQYHNHLNAGVYWADKDWKNINHYYEPVSGKGLWQFNPSPESFSRYWQAALTAARRNDWRRSLFFLGAAAHLAQDLCVPHHARGKLFSGHQEYESWVKLCYREFAVNSGGLYEIARRPEKLLTHNATIAGQLLDWTGEDAGAGYHAATSIVLPLAQRATAGLFHRYFTHLAIPLANGAKCLSPWPADGAAGEQKVTA